MQFRKYSIGLIHTIIPPPRQQMIQIVLSVDQSRVLDVNLLNNLIEIVIVKSIAHNQTKSTKCKMHFSIWGINAHIILFEISATGERAIYCYICRIRIRTGARKSYVGFGRYFEPPFPARHPSTHLSSQMAPIIFVILLSNLNLDIYSWGGICLHGTLRYHPWWWQEKLLLESCRFFTFAIYFVQGFY